MKRTVNIIMPVLLAVLAGCDGEEEMTGFAQTSFLDLEEMRNRGSIIAVTDFNSTNYFIYKGQPMGFHYELLKSLSDFSGVDIEILTENDINRSVEMLNTGKADLLAIDLAETHGREGKLAFTSPFLSTRQVLVQRKPNRWSAMDQEEIDISVVRDISLLKGEQVYVQSGSSALETLDGYNSSNHAGINITEVPYDAEKIISLVARREIDYAVCDENIALVNQAYFPVLDVKTALSGEHTLSWAMRKSKSDQLQRILNEWLSSIEQSGFLSQLYNKYYRNSRSSHIVRSEYYTNSTGKISPWDDAIRSFSDTIGWDWRLLSSLIYQESGFRDDVISPYGAYGLMQVMPSTGIRMGVDIRSSPENNIRAGVMYLRYLQGFFSDRIPDEEERLKFVLGAYNAGEGNILDAMRLAEKYGKNPIKWDDNVAYFLLKKTDPVYYRDPVVMSGYCRGYESVNFVSEILTRYAEYRSIVPQGKD